MPRRFPIPDTRLPFVNAEIAQVQFQGRPALVSSIWRAGGGRLYFWDPESGQRGMRALPEGIPGAYFLRTGPDGRLYLGCGNGALARYDPGRDAFDRLVTGELDGICWGGAISGRRAFWNASRHGVSGAVGVYDLDPGRVVKILSPVDGLTPHALYGHCALDAPDGRIAWVFNVPQARLIVIDPSALTARSVVPPGLEGCAWASAAFLDDRRLVVAAQSGEARQGIFLLLSWPDLAVLARGPMPTQGVHHFKGATRTAEGLFYVADGGLWRFDAERLRHERVAADWTSGEPATAGTWMGRQPCAVTVSGVALRYDPASGRTDRCDLEPWGAMSVHALCAAPQAGLILGAPFITQRFWAISLPDGPGRDLGRAAPGGGQVNQILWDDATRRFLLTSYTTASITAYDPTRPAAWPENPCRVASAQERGQMRPMAFLHDGRCAWMATSPRYGTLGGALCRLDPRSGRFEVRAPIRPGLRPNALAADLRRRRLFVSTDIYGDCNSAPPVESVSVWLVYDLDSGEPLRQRFVPGNAPWSRARAVLPDGRLLARCPEGLALWDYESDAVTTLNEPDGATDLLLRCGEALIGANREAIGLAPLDGNALRFEPRVACPNPQFLHVAGPALYLAAGNEVLEYPLSELGL